MAKPILKLFRPSGSPIILVSCNPCADIQFQGEPLQLGRKIHRGWEGDFRWKSPFISATVRDRPWLLWNISRKSWVPDWVLSFSMTLTRVSRSLYTYKSNISKTVHF